MKQIIFALTFFIAFATIAQNFEGMVIYKNTLKSKHSNMTDDQWLKMMGSIQDYYIKQGQYKSVTNGTMFEWQIYSNKDNMIYSKPTNSTTVLWNDAAVYDDEVLKTEIKKNALTILGYKCDELTLTCKSGIQKYYFAPKLAIDIKLFESHKYANWYEFLKNSKSLSLKTIIETVYFTMETVATEVKPMKLNDELFVLPKNTKTEKNPF